MIPIKSAKDIQMLKQSGSILAAVMHKVGKIVRAGITTLDIDRISEELILKNKAEPAFKGYC